MKHDLLRAGRSLVLPTLAFLAVIAFLPGGLEIAVRVYALVVCGFALTLGLAALRRSFPPTAPFRHRRRARGQGARTPPASLARLEHRTALGIAGAFDLHFRLRPQLRSLALGLLAARRCIALDDEPEVASQLLGDETWELVRADRPAPKNRFARGIAPSDLRRVVESLERL